MTEHPERRHNDVELAMLRKDVELLTERVGDLSEQVSGLVRAWETAGYVVSIVKWMVGLASAIAVIFATIKGVGK
jgi:hypothetical protein